MSISLKDVRKIAQASNKDIKFNRATGLYHVVGAFIQSDGVSPYYSNGRPKLTQNDLMKLISYI